MAEGGRVQAENENIIPFPVDGDGNVCRIVRISFFPLVAQKLELEQQQCRTRERCDGMCRDFPFFCLWAVATRDCVISSDR